jgi:hypothetical protein
MLETNIIVVVVTGPNQFQEFTFTISGDDYPSIFNQADKLVAQMNAHQWRLEPRSL